MKKLRDRVRELTSKRHSGKDVKQIVAFAAGEIISGRGTPTGNSTRWTVLWCGVYGAGSIGVAGSDPRNARAIHWRSATRDGTRHVDMGTVKYPAQVTERRSSVSRVPENGTHGLKGGF